MSKFLSPKYLLISKKKKKQPPSLKLSKNWSFGPHFCAFSGRGAAQKISVNKTAFAAQQFYAKISFQCWVDLREKERTRLRHTQKKRKNLNAVRKTSKWLDRDKRASRDINN